MESISRVRVMGVMMTVTYEVNEVHDPLGTGDSPKEINIDMIEITVGNGADNLVDLLADNVVNEVHEAIMQLL